MDELKKIKIQAQIMEKSLEEDDTLTETKKEEDQEELKEEQLYLTREEAIKLIEEEAKKQMNELIEDLAGRTEFAATQTSKEHPPSYDTSDEVVVTSKMIVDKGNYMNIKRLAILIAQTADLIIGEFSDMQNVIAPEANKLVKKYFAHLAEFVERLP